MEQAQTPEISRMIPAMMHLTDQDECVTVVSDYWLEQLGYNRDEVVGRKIYDFISGESGRFNKRVVVPELLKTGFCNDVPFQFIKNNGNITNVFLSATAEKDDSGNVIGFLNVLVDSSMNRSVEHDLKLSREKVRNLYDYTPDSILIIDPETRKFLDCNLNACEKLGYTRSELLQISVSDLHDDMSMTDIKKIFNKYTPGKSVKIETIYKRKDGSYMPVELISTLVSQGNRRVLLSFVRDITVRRKLEKEKKDLITELKNALDELMT